MLKGGETFTKYGKKGNPHKRLIRLSDDEKTLIWKNVSGCNILCKPRSINLTDVYKYMIFYKIDSRCLYRHKLSNFR